MVLQFGSWITYQASLVIVYKVAVFEHETQMFCVYPFAVSYLAVISPVEASISRLV